MISAILMIAVSILAHRSSTCLDAVSWEANLDSISWSAFFNSRFSFSREVIFSDVHILWAVSLSSRSSSLMAVTGSSVVDSSATSSVTDASSVAGWSSRFRRVVVGIRASVL